MNRLQICRFRGRSLCGLLMVLIAGPSLDAAPIPIVDIRGVPPAEHEEPLPPGAIVRIGSTRFRHPVQIPAHGFSRLFGPPNPVEMRILGGRYLVTTSNTKFTLTDVEIGSRVLIRQAFDGPTARGWLVPTISPDGRRLAITDLSWDTRINGPVTRLWELQNDRATPLKPTASIRDSKESQLEDIEAFFNKRRVFSADGREFYLTSGRRLSVFDPSSGKLLRHFSDTKSIVDIAPNGGRFLAMNANTSHFVVVGGAGGSVIFNSPRYRFRPPAPEPKQPIQWPHPPVQAPFDDIEFEFLDVHDLVTGKKLAAFPATRIKYGSDRHRRLSPNGKYLCTDFCRSLLVWDVDRRLPVLIVIPPKPKDGEPQNAIGDCRFSEDSRLFYATISNWATPSDKRAVKCFDLKSGKEVAAPPRLKAPEPDVDENGVIHPRDPKTGRTLPLPPGYAGVVKESSQDRRLIAIADSTGRIDIWRTDGRFVRNLCAAGPKILCLSFSPDSKQLAASDRGREVRIWSAPDWHMIDRFDVPADSDSLYPEDIVFSPDACRLLIYSGEIMAMWDLRGRSWIWDRAGDLFYDRHGATALFSTDGARLITNCNGRMLRIDPRNGNNLGEVPCELKSDPNRSSAITAIAYSTDGKCLATIHNGHDIQLYDAASTRVIRQFPASESIESRSGNLRFSPDGRRLATCDDRGRAYIWECATGTLAYTLEYPDGDIQDLRFGSDSRTLVTSDHREVIVWSLRPANPPGDAKACWNQLTNFQAAHAEPARWRLLEHPEETLRFLKQQLPPTPPLDQAQVRHWIAELNAGDYRQRERASGELRSWGRRVLKYLRASGDQSAETRRRLVAIIQEIEAGPTAEERRQIRALEIAELIGTADAWSLIESWAKGEKDSVLTDEAAKALSRHVAHNQ